jgi:hypothetical protein
MTPKTHKTPKTPVRTALAAGFLAVSLLAGPAFAQKAPSPGTDITVSKTGCSGDIMDCGMFRTIQEAVNAAKPGQVIEILDTEVYAEQVTIDGRDTSPWDGNNGGTIKKVEGGKNGITIRFVPTAAAKAAGNYKRPVIRYRDTQNQSPKTSAESKTGGELPGSSGNFETCGALRIIRAQGVTIDGLTVDGGGQAVFGWPSIWNSKDALVHGNAAITLVVAGGAVIRNCELQNAYIGINVKDRNTGGVFGMRNPADTDEPIPLSGFGKVGYHLIEYNRIFGNALGAFFESAWDLGSTLRYNLIYNNANDATTKAYIAGSSFPPDAKQNMASGAIMFKDMVYSPVAIYNNTFYSNEMNLIGHWKVGAPHLLFNNVFGKSTVQVTTNGGRDPAFGYDFMAMDGAFQNRMHNSTFSAYINIAGQGQSVYVDYTCSPQNYDTLWIRDATIWNAFGTPAKSSLSLSFAYCPSAPPHVENAVVPGALLTAGTRGFPTAANVRWLEMSKQSITTAQSGTKALVLPDLFQSTDPDNAKFLWPDWDHQYVKDYIQNKGWEDVGIRNADGSRADLGAISSNNDAHQPTVVRIKPTNVVLLNGTAAKASFFLTLESGTMTNPKVKWVRWVAPLPNDFSNFGGSGAPIVPSGDIRAITSAAALKFGSNTIDFTIPQLTVRDSLFGFFEVVVEGTGANGQTVSDVGFLPYRNLDYKLDIRVFAGNAASTSGAGLDTVRAGEPYKVVVTPQRSNGTAVTYTLNEVSYDLLSDATAFMYDTPGDKPRVSDVNLPAAGKTYTVYFTHAGAETIMGAGVYESGSGSLVFLGTKPLTVKPGAPDHAVFIRPIPKAQLAGAPAPVINSGVAERVEVEVQDRFGNAVDLAAEVSIAVTRNPNVGDAGRPGAIATKTVTSAAATGIATFEARVTGGKPRDEFDMTATLVSGPANNGGGDWKDLNVGTLRVGRSVDKLVVFYGDSGAVANTTEDKTKTIDGTAGVDWFKVTVKAIASDAVITGHDGQAVYVEPSDPALKLRASPDGADANTFPIANGIATFWVSADVTVSGACLDVYALNANPVGTDDRDGAVTSGNRCDISFTKIEGSILRAIAFGDGQGRPDSLLVFYKPTQGASFVTDGAALPDSVTFDWPAVGKNHIAAPQTAIAAFSDYVLRVDLRTVRGAGFPTGFTKFDGVGRGNVKVYGEVGVQDNTLDVYEAFGPALTNHLDAGGNPQIVENKNPGVDVDTIKLNLSEQPRDGSGRSIELLYMKGETAPDPATGGSPLTVLDVILDDAPTNAYTVAVAAVPGGLREGDWIRLKPDGALTDRAAAADTAIRHPDNKAHAGNRWVQLREIEAAPSIRSAYYTSNYTETGYVNYLYVEFDKPAADFYRWFLGGSVSIDAAVAVTEANVRDIFKIDPNNANGLVIDLSLAYKSYPKVIRTSGDMAFRLGFGTTAGVDSEGKKWAELSAVARDGAKPVLAEALTLKVGSLTEDGLELPDTLTVVYSERLAASLTAVGKSQPVTIYLSGGAKCAPTLSISDPEKQVTERSNGFFTVTYVVDDIGCPGKSFPVDGDTARVNEQEGVGDRVVPSNVQDVPGNLKQSIKVVRGQLKWVVKVRNNPFRSGYNTGVRDSVGVSLKPGAKGAEKVNIKATVTIYDNLGSLVLVETLDKYVGTGAGLEDEFVWGWKGHNKKGRLVGTGTYLFRAVCEAKILGEGDVVVDEQRYTLQRPLGVVRGKGD